MFVWPFLNTCNISGPYQQYKTYQSLSVGINLHTVPFPRNNCHVDVIWLKMMRMHISLTLSFTPLYIDLKVLDFSSKFWKKRIRFFCPTPYQRGVLKIEDFENWSTIKIRPAYKISVLYLQNQASYSNFSLVNVMRNLNFPKFWNPEISLKFWDFGPNFCMWPLNIQTNKCYI